MKSYLSRKFNEMSDNEKEEFLLKHGVSGKAQIEFAEGKAKQDMELDVTLQSKIIKLDVE